MLLVSLYFRFYFNKLSIRRIELTLLHVSAQGSSSLLLTQLGDVELKPFLQAATSDEAGPWGASCGSDHTLITNPAPRCCGWKEPAKGLENVTGVM